MEIPKANPEDELEFGMQDVGKGAWMPIPVEIPLPKCDTRAASPGPLVCVPSLFLGLIKSQLRAAQSLARLDLIGHLFSARKIIINVDGGAAIIPDLCGFSTASERSQAHPKNGHGCCRASSSLREYSETPGPGTLDQTPALPPPPPPWVATFFIPILPWIGARSHPTPQ